MIKSLMQTLNDLRIGLNGDSRANCPFHEDDRLSFEYDPDSDSYKCGVCGSQGKSPQFVMAFYNIDFGAALRHFGETATPEGLLKKRENAEYSKQAMRGPDETEMAEILNGHIEKLRLIESRMARVIEEKSPLMLENVFSILTKASKM